MCGSSLASSVLRARAVTKGTGSLTLVVYRDNVTNARIGEFALDMLTKPSVDISGVSERVESLSSEI